MHMLGIFQSFKVQRLHFLYLFLVSHQQDR